jgi:hypothetical protein
VSATGPWRGRVFVNVHRGPTTQCLPAGRVYGFGVNDAWRWLVGGVLAIGVGLAVWPTTFILVPAGVVLLGIGVVKFFPKHDLPPS